MKTAFAIPLVALLLGSCIPAPENWDQVRQDIQRRHPSVRHIAAKDLKAWLDDAGRPDPVLLDVRTADEYAVSHLHDARRVDVFAHHLDVLEDLPKDTPIVTYCSVGYRSSEFAQSLIDSGYTQVWQLDGSIFNWANEGYPVYRNGEPVGKVHPYNRQWGRLLERELWAWDP